MRRALLAFIACLVGCAAAEVVAPVLDLPAPPPPARTSSTPAAPTAPAPAAPEPLPLRAYDNLSERVLYAWVSEKEAVALKSHPAALLRAVTAARAPYGVTARLPIDDAEHADEWSTLLAKRGFAARRLAWPNLGGAVLLREPYAFVPVRVTLRPEALVLDHHMRVARRLSGEGVPREEALPRARELGALFTTEGKLRAYVLVNPYMIERVEVGTEAVRAAFAAEISSLERFATELDRVDKAAVPFASLSMIERLRSGAVESAAGWDIGERVVAMRALADVAVAGWSRDLDPAGAIDLRTRAPAVASTCRRLFHAGRRLAPGEWCGTPAMSYHYCSEGCEAGPNETCVPVAEQWK